MFFHRSPVRRIPDRIKDLCLLISSLFIFYLLLFHHPPPPLPQLHRHSSSAATASTPTSLDHLFFSIAASSRSLPNREPYLRLWYNPNSTRAAVFLDFPPSPSFPPFFAPIVVSSDTSAFPYSFPRGSRSAIRIARVVKEAVLLNNLSDVRWFVFGDDDTVFFTENLVKVLSKYDHHQWYYVGSKSESYGQNLINSFDMAFGGGGFAISGALARVLAGVLDSCLFRYPHLYGSDARVYSCLVELGVGLTHEPGFHQVDVRGNLFGMLSAHPLSPLLSLHHLDVVDPIFPNMTRPQALGHLFKAVNKDPARILQQCVCYDRSNSLTISVSWGYSVQVFEGNHLLPDLLKLQRTFRPWRRKREVYTNLYTLNTREYLNDSCNRPVFLLDSVGSSSAIIWTDYTRHIVGNCSRTTVEHSLEHVRVFSQKLDYEVGKVKAPRRQCCDVASVLGRSMVIHIRHCGVDELISMRT